MEAITRVLLGGISSTKVRWKGLGKTFLVCLELPENIFSKRRQKGLKIF